MDALLVSARIYLPGAVVEEYVARRTEGQTAVPLVERLPLVSLHTPYLSYCTPSDTSKPFRFYSVTGMRSGVYSQPRNSFVMEKK